MKKSLIKFTKVSKNNIDTAIKIQNTIFPKENGAINLKASVDKSLIEKYFGDKKNYRENSSYWICKDNKNNMIGITGIYSYFEYPDDAWLGWFGILLKYRGREYGKTILLWTMKKSKKMGFKNFRLYTNPKENKTAIKLYNKVGMIKEKYTVEKIKGEEIIIFSKSLSSNKNKKFGNKNLFLNKQIEIQKQMEN